jgi:hypothetical protein
MCIITHQLHNFCSICEADLLKKPDQRYLTAHQPGQPAFLQNALKVKCTVMCIRIKFYRFGGVFQHICLTFYATFRIIKFRCFAEVFQHVCIIFYATFRLRLKLPFDFNKQPLIPSPSLSFHLFPSEPVLFVKIYKFCKLAVHAEVNRLSFYFRRS